MAENDVIDQPVVEEKTTEVKTDINPFDEKNWVETPIVAEPKKEEKTELKDEVFDEDVYIKNNWGFDSAELAKKELERLRELDGQKTEPLKFANEQSEKYFNALKDGKEDEIYNYLSEKKRFERIEKMEIKEAKDAIEIIKADLSYKYKDLTPEEIERQFARRFPIPKEPKQGESEKDDDFAERTADYKQKLSDLNQDMIIEAKMARPELSKFKNELILPDIKTNGKTEQSQEELAKIENDQKVFQEVFNREYKNFSGYSVKAKDGDVELPVSYGVTDEERNALKATVESFNPTEFLAKRWFSEKDGKVYPNAVQTMDDLYLLQNKDKIFQKIANEAAAQMAAHIRKTRSNTNVNGGEKIIMEVDKPKVEAAAQIDYLWENG